MALGTQGQVKAAIQWGLIVKIELRKYNTGSFVDVGRMKNANFVAEPLSMPGDPTGTDHVYALKYVVSFDMLQSGITKELTLLAGTDGTGLYETNMECKLTYASGRTVTLGAVANYPLRLTPRFNSGPMDDAQTIPVTGQNIEPLTSFVAKVAG